MIPEFLLQHFQLEPLSIEGGAFRVYYRSGETLAADALPARYGRAKQAGNAIVYLLTAGEESKLHRLLSDEIYHFYQGDAVTLLLLFPDGHFETHTLGQDYANGEEPFVVVPQRVWQGSCLKEGGAWALLGCTMAPAYDDTDFALGERGELIGQYPTAAALITRLTPEDHAAHLATDPVKAKAMKGGRGRE